MSNETSSKDEVEEYLDKHIRLSQKEIDELTDEKRRELFQQETNQPKFITENKTPRQIETDWQTWDGELKLALAKRKKDKVTEMLAKKIQETYSIKTPREGEDSTPLIYTEGYYKNDHFTIIDEQVRQYIGPWHSAQVVNSVISKIKADTYCTEDDFIDTKLPTFLPVKNGIVAMPTHKLMAFDAKYTFRHQIPTPYTQVANCPKFLSFISEVMREDDVTVFQEFFGFCLYRGYPFQKALMLLGGGSNGKSTVLRIMRWVIGTENTISLSLQAISDSNNFEGSEIKGKYLNLVGDSGGRYLKDLSGFKEFTGNEAVTRKRKNLSTVTFIPFAKHVFSYNELPIFADQSDGNMRRWILIEFPHRFVTKKEWDLLSEAERENVMVADEDKIDAIFADEMERSGILKWAITGLNRLLDQKGFSYNKTTEQTRDIIVKKGDPFGSFVDSRIKEDDGGRVLKSKLEEEFIDWCKHEGIVIKFNPKKMRNAVLSRFPGVEDKTIREVGLVGKAYCNVVMSDCNRCNQCNLVSKTHRENKILVQYENTVTPVTPVTNEFSDDSVSSVCRWVVSQGNDVPLDAFLERFGAETFARLKASGDLAEYRANSVSAVFPGDYE